MSRTSAIFAATLALFLTGSVAWIAYGQAVSDDARSKTGAEKRDSPPSKELEPSFTGLENAIKGVARAIEAAKTSPDSASESQRAEQDLKAQQDMAKWAMAMFWVTLASVMLSAIGVFLIWRTLRYTKHTVDATRDALKEAEKTTAVARDTLSTTRFSNERQLRAYVGVDPSPSFNITTMNTNDGPKRILLVVIKATNFGQSPAREYSYAHATKFLKRNPNVGWELPGGHITTTSLMPSQSADFSIAVDFSEEVERDIRNGGEQLFLWGYVKYEDVFAQDVRCTNFRFKINARSLVENFIIRSVEGNNAT